MPFSTLPRTIAGAIESRGYAEPTPVQAAVLEPGAVGRDLLVSAQTGSGKTIAFGMAMAADLLGDSDRVGAPGAPLALVIAPTRELALQVSGELSWLYAQTGARITTCVGGMNPSVERRALYQGAHIVVGTPGRLRDHLERGVLQLTNLRFVVLDEADEMLDMGFREDLEQILDATPEARRTMLFSATMPSQIAALAKRYQRDALRITTVGQDRGHGDISYQAMAVAPADIEHAVVNLLRFHEAETAILFCATRDNVRHLHATLIERGFAAVALSGEHSQSERNQALQALRDGRARVCVATDVAARGIDVASLSLVVHVEVPRDAEVLQHRSGRTGRAGRKGTAVLIVPYQRRRRVEGLLRSARVEAAWIPVPSADAIRAQDRERLLTALSQPVEANEDDRAIALRLLEQRSAEEIAIALVQAHRAKMPEPEDMAGENDGPSREPVRRDGFDDVVWFRMDIGRRQNADARWLLPLLCRRGHISRNEVGAIRIGQSETYFQIPTAVAAKFADAVQRTANPDSDDENSVRIEQSAEAPRDMARQNRREPGQAEAPRPPVRRTLAPREGGAPRSNGPRQDGPRPNRGPGGSGKPPFKGAHKGPHGKGPRGKFPNKGPRPQR